MRKYYPLIRELHLHFGLLISPFLLLFSLSVLLINHPGLFNLYDSDWQEEQHQKLGSFQFKEDNLSTAKSIIDQLNITGEIDWISKTDSTISFPVHKPGLTKHIFLNTTTGEATIRNEKKGTGNGLAYLHTMPGPHNAMLRGNSFFMKMWRVATDSLVYIVLFVTSSGIFLWYFLKPERNLGLYFLGGGILTFLILMFLLL